MADHTPGPWTVESLYDGSRTVAIVRPLFTRDAFSGRLHAPYVNAAQDWVGDADGDRLFANARLIAAAPDLLAALRDLCDAIPDETVGDDPPLGVWIQHGRDAIAKAEGR
jgi:hypothetical protein